MVVNVLQYSHHRKYGMVSLIEMLVQQLITTNVNLIYKYKLLFQKSAGPCDLIYWDF